MNDDDDDDKDVDADELHAILVKNDYMNSCLAQHEHKLPGKLFTDNFISFQ